jgi:Transposase DDE domain group 1
VTASSHNLDVRFDAKGLVANAGLVLPTTLAQRLGLPDLLRQHVQLGKVPGAANPDRKAMTAIASLLAGGEHVDDVNVLRAGGTGAEILGVAPAAASTVGTFLRAFTSGHARQLDAVQEDLHQRAWAAGARPSERTVKLDLDSTVVETFGLQKQGGKHFTYLNTRGYHPILAVIAESGEVVHSRLREGRATAGRGAGSFARQALARLGRLGTINEVVVRADSGFYAEKVVTACQAHGARFSISVRLQKSHHELIAAIPEEARTPIPYWLEGAADVAEIAYRPFGKKRAYRFIVRRVAPTAGSQLWLKGVAYSHFAFITDRAGEMLELEADHRQHAVVENVIRDLKYGLAVNHMPSGKFGANAAWLALNVIAHNLTRWMGRLAGFAIACLKAWRLRFFALPGRLVAHGRRRRLRLPAGWPWRGQFLALLAKLRAVPTLLTT